MSVILIVLVVFMFIGLASGYLAANRERRLPWAFLLAVVGVVTLGLAFLDVAAGLLALPVGLVELAGASIILAPRRRPAQ
jgi:hypothetical protein